MSAAADEVRVSCGANYPDAGAAYVERPDACASPCPSMPCWGRPLPPASAPSLEAWHRINSGSPACAWWTSNRWSISDVMAREIEDLGYASLLGGTERLVVGTGISSVRGGCWPGPPGQVRLPTRDATTPAPSPDGAPCQERGRLQTGDTRTSPSLSDAAVGRATREPEPACEGPRPSGAPSRWPVVPADCGCTA